VAARGRPGDKGVSTTTQEAARRYIERGFAPIPLPPNSKNPGATAGRKSGTSSKTYPKRGTTARISAYSPVSVRAGSLTWTSTVRRQWHWPAGSCPPRSQADVRAARTLTGGMSRRVRRTASGRTPTAGRSSSNSGVQAARRLWSLQSILPEVGTLGVVGNLV
jgi:hypothetical protein